MIRVVGANPAMDRIAIWPPLRLGTVNRASDVVVVAGGKGLNVCHGIRDLGAPVAAYGFTGGIVGEAIHAGCEADGIDDRFTSVAGETRVCMIVIEPEPGRSTVLNEPGPPVTLEEAGRLCAAVAEDCGSDDLLIVSGTLPLGLPTSVAARLVAIGREAGCRVIVDSSGPTLRAAVDAMPWLVKCNAGEFSALHAEADPNGVAPAPDDPLALVGPARRLLDRGVSAVVITLGRDGLLAITPEGALQVRPPAVRTLNPIGAGDMLLAALAVRIVEGSAVADSLAFATACAAASVARLAPEIPPPDVVAALLDGVRVEPVVAPAEAAPGQVAPWDGVDRSPASPVRRGDR